MFLSKNRNKMGPNINFKGAETPLNILNNNKSYALVFETYSSTANKAGYMSMAKDWDCLEEPLGNRFLLSLRYFPPTFWGC